MCMQIFDGVYHTHLHDIVGNMLPSKKIAKCRGFLVQGATKICPVQNHTRAVHKHRCGFG